MSIRRIEVPIWTNGDFDGLLGSARIVAERFGAHVDVRFIRPRPADLVMSTDFAYFPSNVMDIIEEQGIEAAAKARGKFDSWRDHHLSKYTAFKVGDRPRMVWHEEVGAVTEIVAAHGRLADIVLLQRPLDEDLSLDEAFEAAMFRSGRLALLVDETPSEELFDHVMIAWNGSVESSRAVAQAMPVIQIAGRVSVFTAGEDKKDPVQSQGLIDYLAMQGVNARRLAEDPDAGSVSAALFSAARHAGVSLLVMGAYTHSRLRQTLLGGVTRDVLSRPGLAALMGH
jgi:nucleotide-binding universal stress UspA family protein